MTQANSDTEHRRKHRIAVAVFFFIAGFIFASWASRIPHIQQKLHLSEAGLGAVLFALPVGLMTSLLLAGAIIARAGSRTAMLIAAISYSLILTLLGLAQHTWQLVAGLFLFGMAGNLCNISMNTQAVGVEKIYGRPIIASFHGVWSIAGFTGAALGTGMVALELEPWQHFMVAAAIGLLLTFLFAGHTLPNDNSTSSQPLFAWPDKSILMLGLMAFGCLVCEGTMFDWSGVYFSKAVQAPAHLTTLGYSLFMGCMATGRFVADGLVARWGPRKLLIGAGLIICTGLLTSVVWPNVITASVGFMLVGFGVSSVVPITYSLAGRHSRMHTGQALAAVSTVGFLGFLVGPPMIGFIAEATSLRWSFALVALIGLSTSYMASRLPR